MGFDLDAYIVFDDEALAAYDALIPGMLSHVLRAEGSTSSAVPTGYVLPMVSDLIQGWGQHDMAWRWCVTVRMGGVLLDEHALCIQRGEQVMAAARNWMQMNH